MDLKVQRRRLKGIGGKIAEIEEQKGGNFRMDEWKRDGNMRPGGRRWRNRLSEQVLDGQIER